MRTYDDVHELIKRLRNNKVTLGHGEYGVDPLCELAAKELDNAINEIERLRAALRSLVGAVADHTSQKSIPDALREARAALEGRT